MGTRVEEKGDRDATLLEAERPVFLLGPHRDVEVSSEELQTAQWVGERQERHAQQATTKPINPTF